MDQHRAVARGAGTTCGSLAAAWARRGCIPAPGAWTSLHGRKLRILEARKHLTRRFADVSGKPGEITHIGPTSVTISTQGGSLELLKVRLDGADKSSAASVFTSLGVSAGMRLNTPLRLGCAQQ